MFSKYLILTIYNYRFYKTLFLIFTIDIDSNNILIMSNSDREPL